MTGRVIGIIGGSGLYRIDGLVDVEWRRVESPFGRTSDEFCFGTLGDQPVVFLPRHGRGHVLPPSAIPFRANIDALKRCGVTDIISLSAVGSLREDLAPGDLRVSCALVDASGEEVTPDSKTLGAVAAGHTMVLDREKLLREKPRAPKASLAFHDGSDRREIPVGAEPLAIGRDPQNDIVLDDRRVSRKHAEIRLRLGRYTLYDLQSTNGTYVNGRRVAEMVLSDGDRVAIGGVELQFRSAD